MIDKQLFVGRTSITVDGVEYPNCDTFLEIRDSKVYPLWTVKRRFFFFKKIYTNLMMDRIYYVKIIVNGVYPELINNVLPYVCTDSRLGTFQAYGDDYSLTKHTTTLRSFGAYIEKRLIKRYNSNEWEEKSINKYYKGENEDVTDKNANVRTDKAED